MIQSWLAKNEEYTPQQWFSPPNISQWDPTMRPDALPRWWDVTFEGQVYTWLQGALKSGVSTTTVDSVVNWLNTMWPRVDWHTVAYNPQATGYDHSKVPLKPVQTTAQ